MLIGAWTSPPSRWASKASPLPEQPCKRPANGSSTNKLRKSFFVVVCSALLLLAGCSSSGQATGLSAADLAKGANAVVNRVIDGDTIEVKASGKLDRVRLIGIDTPETVDPNRPVGCYGKEASDFTKAQLPKGTAVRLVLDVEARDKYKRLLAYVYRTSDDLFINAELARQGYAQALTIPPNVAHTDEFADLVSEARDNQRGLWSKCQQ